MVASGGSMNYSVCLHLRHVSVCVSVFLYKGLEGDFVEGNLKTKVCYSKTG